MNFRSFNICFVSILLASLAVSCLRKKNIPPDFSCDNSVLTVGNLIKDTIYYGWNTNMTPDTLLPGAICVFNGGAVAMEHDFKGGTKSETSYVTMITSTKGSWFIKMDKCAKRCNFEYDIQNPNSGLVYLYDAE